MRPLRKSQLRDWPKWKIEDAALERGLISLRDLRMVEKWTKRQLIEELLGMQRELEVLG